MSARTRRRPINGELVLAEDVNAPFGVLAHRLQELGYTPIPLRAKEKIPAVRGWPSYEWQPDDFSIPLRRADGTLVFPDYATGLVTSEVVAADVDFRDAKICKLIAALLTKMLGPGPDRVGAPPKFLRMYRTLEPFPKIRSNNTALAGDDVAAPGYKYHAVEILGRGQQFAAYGIHNKTGRPYRWIGGLGPLTVPVSHLTVVTQAQCLEFVAETEKLLVANGATFAVRVGARAQRKREAPREAPEQPPKKAPWIGDKFPKKFAAELAMAATVFAKNARRPVRSFQALNPSACRKALALIPNHDLHYDDWVRIGLAVAGALGESGFNDFVRFSMKSAKYDAMSTEVAYRGFLKYRDAGMLRIGAGTIMHLAREARSSRRPARSSVGVRR